MSIATGRNLFLEWMDVVQWESGQPVKIALSVEPKVSHHKYAELEGGFYRKSIEELPREVWGSLVFEVDWPDEKVKS